MALSSSARPFPGIRSLVLAVLGAWFVFALAGSLLGIFDSQPRPPIPLGVTALGPIAVFAVWYLTSLGFREFVSTLNLRLLTFAQVWRVVGIVFVILYWRSALPGVFALPAGLGDVAIGITAPVVAWLWKPPYPRKMFVMWNLLGSLDLVLAVSLGVLSSATPVGLLAGDISTRLMGQFPLSLIPTFFVPLFLIFHLISLDRVRRERP